MKSYIQSIGTATPGSRIPQEHILKFMLEAHGLTGTEAQRLRALYRATGIKYRYSVIPDYANHRREFYPETADLEPFPSVKQRMGLFRAKAISLALEAIEDCIASLNSFSFSSVTHLITVSCTGMYAPGLDIELVGKLGLNTSVERTAVNYMGCYAAINAIRLADSICRSREDATVLIVCLELCSIHFQKAPQQDNFLANALFSDGAAAVIQSSREHDSFQLIPEKFHCNLVNEGKQDMAWSIGNFGFEMKLSAYVPQVIRSGVKKLITQLVNDNKMNLSGIDFFAIHPGGKSILEAVEDELNISREKSQYAFDVLRDYGNMSSVSVLFVLKKILVKLKSAPTDQSYYILGLAFGPGLTLESMILSANRE